MRSNSKRIDKTKQDKEAKLSRQAQAEKSGTGSGTGTNRGREQAAAKLVTQTHFHTNGQAVLFMASQTDRRKHNALTLPTPHYEKCMA